MSTETAQVSIPVEDKVTVPVEDKEPIESTKSLAQKYRDLCNPLKQQLDKSLIEALDKSKKNIYPTKTGFTFTIDVYDIIRQINNNSLKLNPEYAQEAIVNYYLDNGFEVLTQDLDVIVNF